MPYQDQTGPQGNGPMTGRAMGSCAGGYSARGYNCPRRGMGRGYGRGYGYNFTPTKKEEKEMLTEEKKFLQKELEAIEERIADMK